jgi:hypothetical protein
LIRLEPKWLRQDGKVIETIAFDLWKKVKIWMVTQQHSTIHWWICVYEHTKQFEYVSQHTILAHSNDSSWANMR